MPRRHSPKQVRTTRYEIAGWVILIVALVFSAFNATTNLGAYERWLAFTTTATATGFALIALGARQQVKVQEAETARFKAETERIGTPDQRERIVTGSYGSER
jgi:hypothetical protein